MRNISYIVTATFLLITAMPNEFFSQGSKREKETLRYQLASSELDTVIDKSNSIRDPRKFNSIRARAANLLWLRDPEEARRIFSQLWIKIDKELDDSGFDKESARIDLLEQIFPRDREFATKLISSSSKGKKENEPLIDRIKGTNPATRRLAFLAYRVAEDDAGLAAVILESGLAENTAPSFPLILARIRSSNPVLANYVVAQALERFSGQAPTTALCGLVNVAAYLFPFSPSPSISVEALDSDEALRQEYTRVSLIILRRSLAEKEEALIRDGYNEEALGLRRFNQALVANLLAVLSSRYSQQDFPEMTVLSVSLLQPLPKTVGLLIEMQVAAAKAILGKVEESETSDAEIITAIAREDFTRAELLISSLKDEVKKKSWLNILFRAVANVQLKKGEGVLALGTARKIEEVGMAVPVLLEVLKFANRKKDESLSISAFQEISSQAGELKKGAEAKTMFAVAAEIAYSMKDLSLNSVQKSVETINGLSEIKNEQTKPVSYRGTTYWDDPDSFLSSSAMQRAFSTLGEIDLDEALTIANKFRDNSLKMVARLAAVERTLRKGPPKIEPKKSGKKPT